MALGVEHSRKVLKEVGELAEGLIDLVKHRTVIGMVFALPSVLGDVKDLVAAAPKALPELGDIDQAEASLIAGDAYALVRRIIVKIAAA